MQIYIYKLKHFGDWGKLFPIVGYLGMAYVQESLILTDNLFISIYYEKQQDMDVSFWLGFRSHLSSLCHMSLWHISDLSVYLLSTSPASWVLHKQVNNNYIGTGQEQKLTEVKDVSVQYL